MGPEYKWIHEMTNTYIAIQAKLESFLLDFLQSDHSDVLKLFVWMLRFAGIVLVWLWLMTFIAVWPGQVSARELGPVWLVFGGISFQSPWAALAWTLWADGSLSFSAWLLRLCGLIMAFPGVCLAKELAGPVPRLPSKHERFVYGGHFLKADNSRAELGHTEASGVIVGYIKGLPCQKSYQLACTDPCTDCLILGDGPIARNVFQAALKSFDGAIIRIGTDRLAARLVAETDIIRIAPSQATSFPIDPLRQVRPGSLAWFDVRAMLYPCRFRAFPDQSASYPQLAK
jgi:hypothetical protein